MHIAYLTPEYPHKHCGNSGGLGTSIKNLVSGLVDKGIKVSVIVYGQKKQLSFTEGGVEFYFLKSQNFKFAGWYRHRKWIQSHLNLLIKSKSIDLIEAPDWTGITAFMKVRCPLIIRLHGSDAYFCHLEGRNQKLKNRFFEKLALKRAVAWIAPTSYALETTKSIFRIEKKKSYVIPYCLNLDEFNNPLPRKFKKGLILYIGTIIRKKGVFELPLIIKKVQEKFEDYKMILVGTDSADIETGSVSTWKLLEKEFENNGIKEFKYLGKMPYEDVKNLIISANVCVFPSFAETFGMVTIESMALQKAVINTNIGWANELIEDGKNGFLIHPTDHQRYADRIIQLIREPLLAEEIGKKAQFQVVQKFSREVIVDKNIKVYNELLKNEFQK